MAEMENVKEFFSLANTEHSIFSSDKIQHPSSSRAGKKKGIITKIMRIIRIKKRIKRKPEGRGNKETPK